MPGRPFLGYVRVSSDEQIDGYGLDVQRASLQAYCQAMDYRLSGVVSDEGFSGSTLKRPGIQRVIELLQTREYAGAIVYKLDRISRNLKDILILHDDVFKPCDAAIVSVKEQLETNTPVGKLMFQILGGFAEFEREVIKDRMYSGRVEKAKAGRFAGGSAPYGYTLTAGELVTEPQEAQAVRLMFAKRAAGETLQQIADHLNAIGAPTKRGGIWSRPQIKFILDREPFYRGSYTHGGVTAQGVHAPIL